MIVGRIANGKMFNAESNPSTDRVVAFVECSWSDQISADGSVSPLLPALIILFVRTSHMTSSS